MADSRSLQLLTRTTGGKDETKNIPYVNPNATAANLHAFAQGTAALTTNSYIDAVVIDKTSLNNMNA